MAAIVALSAAAVLAQARSAVLMPVSNEAPASKTSPRVVRGCIIKSVWRKWVTIASSRATEAR